MLSIKDNNCLSQKLYLNKIFLFNRGSRLIYFKRVKNYFDNKIENFELIILLIIKSRTFIVISKVKSTQK